MLVIKTYLKVNKQYTAIQVIWLGRPVTESSWELASSFPDVLIQDYEHGIQHDLHQKSYTSGRQTIHTLYTVCKEDETSPPEAKRPRVIDNVQ